MDLVFLQYTIHGTIQSSGQSVMLLFAFEYVIQVRLKCRACDASSGGMAEQNPMCVLQSKCMRPYEDPLASVPSLMAHGPSPHNRTQASSIVKFFLKYVMSMIDLRLEGRWESKSTYVFYLELVTDLLHLFVYCVFFLLVFTNYGLPLHLIRELYSTFRNFRNRIVDFLRFRQVSQCLFGRWMVVLGNSRALPL